MVIFTGNNILPATMTGESLDILANNLEQLRALFPQVFTEGKLDLEKFKATFTDKIHIAGERYVLNWAGKADAFRALQVPATGTLLPQPEESVNFDEAENIFIEGENLEVLKLLQKAYYNKIKCIIIDPPYNTGSDSFIYPDSFKESRSEYEKRVGDKDEEGQWMKEGLFRKNSKDSGHFHSNWLSMMYPRLFLARNLLTDDGVIFVFIDDNELHNLKQLMNEVFGEENFLSNITWEKRYTRSNDAKFFASVIDHVLVYKKGDKLKTIKQPRDEKSNSIYTNPDNDPRGLWTSVSYVSQRTKSQRKNLSYSIKNPFTGIEVMHPTNAWKFSKEQNDIHAKENKLWWGNDGGYQFPRLKKFLSELPSGIVPSNLWKYQESGTVDDGTKEVDRILGKDVFDYPKPTSVIKKAIDLCVEGDNGDIILDFFAGSGTCAHAILEMNKKDGGNRKFIAIQIPEECSKESEAFKRGFKTISDLSQFRVKKVIEEISLQLKDTPSLYNNSGAFGFKSFKLTDSNFKLWRGKEVNEENLEAQLQLFTHPLADDATPQGVLYELMLKAGLPLTATVQSMQKGGRWFLIAQGELAIALETATPEMIGAMVEAKPQRVLMLDECFKNNDQLKTNTVLQMKDAGVEFKTI